MVCTVCSDLLEIIRSVVRYLHHQDQGKTAETRKWRKEEMACSRPEFMKAMFHHFILIFF